MKKVLIFIIFLTICLTILSQDYLTEEELFKNILKEIEEQIGDSPNKKIAILNFLPLDGSVSLKEALLFKEKLIQNFVVSKKFDVLDSSFLGLENPYTLKIEEAKKLYENLNLSYVIAGSFMRINEKEFILNWKLIEVKGMTILKNESLKVKTITTLTEKDSDDITSSMLEDLEKKINEIKSSPSLSKEKKEEMIVETIAIFFKPLPSSKYTSTYFSCDLAGETCKNLHIKDGFYKIYYDNELVLTVNKEGKIVESYYYGKNNPVRKDVSLKEIISKSVKKQ